MKNTKRKIMQYFPANSLGKVVIELSDERISTHWKNLFSSYHRSFYLKNMNPEYETGRREYDDWGNICYIFLLVFIVAIPWLRELGIYVLLPLIITCIFFLLKFKKYDWVYFWDVNHTNTIQIRIPGKNDQERKNVQDFVGNLKMEIEKARISSNGN